MKKLVLLALLIYALPASCLAEAKKQILFIVNPISHEIKGQNLPQIIQQNLNLNLFDYKIAFTQRPQHATELAQEALKEGVDIVAAVGGDGTVNEVGKALIHSNAILAIVPVGSGNGLARHLHIPMGLKEGIKALNHCRCHVIDTGQINDKAFLGIAGIGFDAHVAEQFSKFGKRGLWSYCQVALREFAKYQSKTYLINLDGKRLHRKAFILSFANSSQYGNNFIIAPSAKISDGYLDLVIIEELSLFSIPKFLVQLKQSCLCQSDHYETYRFKELTIDHPSSQVHIDGEPMKIEGKLKVSILPKSLKVLIP